MATNQYQGKKFCDDNEKMVEDNLTIEQALQININSKPFTVTMRTPGNDIELITGLLYSEDIYRDSKPLKIEITEDTKKNITEANINIDENLLRKGYSNSRSILSVSSCGICGKTELPETEHTNSLDESIQLDIKTLYSMFKLMKKDQATFLLSGGSHAAAAFTMDGTVLYNMEDIGRHNAVDKVIGYLIANNSLEKAKCITVSGRISYEILFKAFAAKIPILAAVSAPSSLAVDYSKELGITLLGFCREGKATCYSHPNRIKSTLKG